MAEEEHTIEIEHGEEEGRGAFFVAKQGIRLTISDRPKLDPVPDSPRRGARGLVASSQNGRIAPEFGPFRR